MHKSVHIKIAIIGMGYVGLQLARWFATIYPTVGYDVRFQRIKELQKGIDSSLELEGQDLQEVLVSTNPFIEQKSGIFFTHSPQDISSANIYIIAVPTPIDNNKKPNLQPLLDASKTVGQFLKKGDIVIYESTVYPGCTEEDCVPVLERTSGLTFNVDFFCGYSPERINPGDNTHKLTQIKKVIAGSTPEIANKINSLYTSIISAGTYITSSIKVAEAAKLVENCQRDLNISFVNELAIIFDRLNIDTYEVLAAAETKWNFIKFTPGLVGGHCIAVDPYYLIAKSEQSGYTPEVISAGRRINENMGIFISQKIIKLMINKNISIKGAKVLILGFTYKENCTDIRNTQVIDLYRELNDFGMEIDIFDPWAKPTEVFLKHGIHLTRTTHKNYHAVILAVAHDIFAELNFAKTEKCIIFDVKGFWDTDQVDGSL